MKSLIIITLSTLAIVSSLFLMSIVDIMVAQEVYPAFVTPILYINAFIPVGMSIGFAGKRRNRSFILWTLLGMALPLTYIVLRHVHYRNPQVAC